MIRSAFYDLKTKWNKNKIIKNYGNNLDPNILIITAIFFLINSEFIWLIFDDKA